MKIFIKGMYTQCIYEGNNGYTVGLFRVLDTNDEELDKYKNRTINFVGTFYNLKERSNYIFYGNITNHPKYGFQFNVSEYELLLPEEKDELITFLSSKLFPIGEATAKKIVNKFGNDSLKVILDSPDSLLDIPRMTELKIRKIHEILLSYQESSHIIMELTKLGFSSKHALDIYHKYQNATLSIVNSNIYEIIEDIKDINFKEVDEIALNSGINITDENRLNALIIYTMSNICFETGNTYLLLEEINNNINIISSEELEYLLIKLQKRNKISIVNNRYYLKHFYDEEQYIVKRLCYLNDLKNKNDKKISMYISRNENNNNITYDDMQRKAITLALNNNLAIITGGPGTGKTTIIRAIVDILMDDMEVKSKNIALLAPTGRASKKMCEKMVIGASTIHRFLKWNKETNDFSVNEYDPSGVKYIIVDEVSMIDTSLMASLLKGLQENIKLILIGDYNQLPSVREGQVLKDLIDSESFDVVKLTSLYRQNENSYIINLANEIKNKELSNDFTILKDDYNFIEVPNGYISNTIDDIIDKAITKSYDDIDIQVLAPMYKGENGIDNLNKKLQEKFNPRKKLNKEIEVGDVIYRVGDKILQLVNDPENNVFNGDLGFIHNIISSKESKSKRNEIVVNFDGNFVTYTPADYINIRHGWAMSVHKAQGSEFTMVIIPITNSFKRMLYNKLIYTAVTRAKSYLILVGDRKAFEYSVYNDYIESRRTSLKEFVANWYNNKINS